MTQYVTKFEAWFGPFSADVDENSEPGNWTVRLLGAAVAGAYRTSQPDGPVKKHGWSSRSCTFYFDAPSAVVTWGDIDGDANRANAEILVGLRSAICEIAVRQQGAASTHYYARFNAGALSLYKLVTGTETLLGSGSVTADPSGLYYLRLRVNGTALSLKGWGRDASEPGSPQISVTDSSISAAGSVGVRQGTVDFFSVATNGDSAIAPMLVTKADAALCAAVIAGANPVFTCDVVVPAYTGSGSVAGRAVRRYANRVYSTGTVAPVGEQFYQPRVNGIPVLSREMPELAGGVTSVSEVDVILDNAGGELDDLFRMRLFRAHTVCRIGLVTWPWYDLLPYHQGVLQDAQDQEGRFLKLVVDGMARALDGDLNVANSTSGPNAGKPIPESVGSPRNVSPVLVDAATLKYSYANSFRYQQVAQVRDRGVALTTRNITLSAFDAAADWLESAAAHDLLANDPIKLTGAPPAPLVVGTVYFAKTIVTTTRFTLSATRGGAVINLTGTTGAITATAVYQPWIYSFMSFQSIELSRQPAGQITLDIDAAGEPVMGGLINVTGLPQIRSAVGASAPTPAEPNFYFQERQSRISVLDGMSATGIPVGFNRSGALTWRPIDFSSVQATLTAADCFSAPRLVKLLPPRAYRVGEPNWTVQSPTDLAGSVTPANVALYGGDQYYLIDAVGIDAQAGLWWGGLVDDPALYRERPADQSVGGIASTNTFTPGVGYTYVNSKDARQRAAGIYEITVAFKSLLIDCGDVVKLTHPRHFFKDVVNEVDISPERPATAIGAKRQPSLAVVTKIVDDPASSRQTLTLYRPMPTLFPAS